MTRCALILLAAGAVLAACGAGAVGAAPKAGATLDQDGPLVEHAPRLARLLSLRLDEKTGRLLLDREAWKEADQGSAKGGDGAPAVQAIQIGGQGQAQIQIRVGGGMMVGGDSSASPAEAVFDAIRQAVGGSLQGRSRSTHGTTCTFGGGQVSGSLRTSGDRVEVSFTENRAPGRTIEVLDDPDGPCRLLFSDPGGDLVLVNQPAKGRCVVVTVAGDEAAARTAPSFAAYRQAHPAEAEALLARLARVGAAPPLTADSPEVREAVLKAVRGMAGAGAEAFQRVLRELDDPDYHVRERATKDLIKRYGEFEAQVRAAQDAPALSAEVRNRLQRVVRESACRADPRLARWLHLTRDVPYLIGLLGTAGAKDRPAVAAQLGRLTGQSLGDDPAAWRRWQETAPPAKGP
jgi:hypothetical protein